MQADRKIRISLPSKGFLGEKSRELLANVGFQVYSPNPRQYQASIPRFPFMEVIFQRPGDIVHSVRSGSVDFGITGRDVFLEKRDDNGQILELHKCLDFAHCTLNVITPKSWSEIGSVSDLKKMMNELGRPLKIASKFPNLTKKFFDARNDLDFKFIAAEGALEIAPTVGYADLIVDIVSTGTTLRDNHLKMLRDGEILKSQACLIANKARLKENDAVREIAVQFLEVLSAFLRAEEKLAIFANIRGDSPEDIAEKIFGQKVIGGLQGPTISQVITQDAENWYAVHLIVAKSELHEAVKEIRAVGGSGVVVSDVNYLFEEEPKELAAMFEALSDE
ncbi:MAG: ATP phosphoribosyltransferase [Anaerolineae bacterium]|jgi:ATP phosphoribosyltransferase|nr:ATP phosphoribosyltransferase [Anaerolineae bacterium]MBT7071031.1 ATP phosphoribosyltransferase [Anaerolineae bacterium]MBT7323737.1 ATP phosphoribosyltransferase [Anaerolineae bacterium]